MPTYLSVGERENNMSGSRENFINGLSSLLAIDSCDDYDYMLDMINESSESLDEIVPDLSKACKTLIIAGDRTNLKKALESAKVPAKKLDEYHSSLICYYDILISLVK